MLIANPRAGFNRGLAAAEAAASVLWKAGLSARVMPTARAGHAPDLVREALDQGATTFLAVGGDGTLNEVAGGLDRLGLLNHVPVSVIPVGTANVMAREFRIPLGRPEAAAQALLKGRIQEVDVGRVHGHLMLVNCGVGFDADVVRRLSVLRRMRRGRLSKTSYVLPGVIELIHGRRHDFRVFVDDRLVADNARSVTICNTRNYGGIFAITPRAKTSDGELDVCVRRPGGRLKLIAEQIYGVMQAECRWTSDYYTGRTIRVESTHPAAVQQDGDLKGRTPLVVSLADQKLSLIIPKGESL